MRVLVVYYSQTGRTKRVAKQLVSVLEDQGVKVEESPIEPVEGKDYRTNVREAREGVEAEIKPTLTDVSDYSVVCIGTPVWSSSPATPVNGYLASCSGLEGKKIACFATYGGGSARSTLRKLKTKSEEKGAQVIGSLDIDSTRPFNGKVKGSIKDFAITLLRRS